MSDNSDTWRAKLATWLETNPKTTPADAEQLRADFVHRFPSDKIEQLSLEGYALGHASSAGDSFCYWLEFKTKALGSISGGRSAKFGVWWDRATNAWRYNQGSFSNPEDALQKLTHGIALLIDAVQNDDFSSLDQIGATALGANRYGLRAKPLYLYFPDKFLPIASPGYLRHALHIFGQPTDGDLLGLNRRLLQALRNLRNSRIVIRSR
jgi:5-methylcytosine-specific restriction enzyme B